MNTYILNPLSDVSLSLCMTVCIFVAYIYLHYFLLLFLFFLTVCSLLLLLLLVCVVYVWGVMCCRYSDKDILRLASEPLLTEVAKNIRIAIMKHSGIEPDRTTTTSSSSSSNNNKTHATTPRCHVYLSHDVILLALHKSVEYLVQEETGQGTCMCACMLIY
jgi:hypothetical protein